MVSHRSFYQLIVVALFMVTACTPQGALAPTASSPATQMPAQVATVTLRLAVSDAQEAPSGPYVLEFMAQVKNRSGGSITIEPTWDAGATTTPPFEQGVVKGVTEGRFDLGLAGSRAWDSSGVTSFEALQAPFLISNDDLAKAVATSDIAKRMLDGLSSSGATGLTIWPEDLRHPFSVVPGKSILSPGDFAGLTVRAIGSKVTYLLIEKMGGKPVYDTDDYQAAESGLRQGASLQGAPTATGNVVFFPKFQVLFANAAVFKKLSAAQQTMIREAAAAAQKKAIAEHPSDAENGKAWCADGGTVVLASADQVAAFEEAAQPVFDSIEQDPTNKALIAAIRDLKAKTPPSAGAEACAPMMIKTSPQATTGNEIWTPGLPPNGVWRVQLSTDDFVEMGVLKSIAEAEWAGVHTLALFDGHLDAVYQDLHGGVGRCQANYEVVKDFVRIHYYPVGDQCTPAFTDDVQWRVDEKGLHLHLVNIEPGTHLEGRVYYEAKPWQKLPADTVIWSLGLPPNGMWRVELTVDDLVGMGILKSEAEKERAGEYTLTFQDGKAEYHYKHYKDGWESSCTSDLTIVENLVRVTYTSGDDCKDEVDDVQWRLGADGLHLHLVAIQNSQYLPNKAWYEAKPWQKIK